METQAALNSFHESLSRLVYRDAMLGILATYSSIAFDLLK